MASYISSIANRFYCAIEQNYGSAASISASDRFPAVRLQASQVIEQKPRHDKTGSRTFLGAPRTGRRHTAFQVRTYLTTWSGTEEPSYGALFQAALGTVEYGAATLQVATVRDPLNLKTAASHGLTRGSAVSLSNEIRFVSTASDQNSLTLNAPFSVSPNAGDELRPTVAYKLATALPSVTLYDYWDPASAVSRIVVGAAIDTAGFLVNGDYHEFVFGGPAADLLDSATFLAGAAGLPSFPSEPLRNDFDYAIVPGHLGQVWLGSAAQQFFTLSSAKVELKNNLETRSSEFGSAVPRAVVAGSRQVGVDFSVYVQDDLQTVGLYEAAKRRNTISAMLQLGQEQGQLMGVYIPSVMPEIPAYDDSESRLQWKFTNNLAQGTIDDELFIAFA